MRITYQGGKLYISLTKIEIKDVKDNEGRPCEIDIGHISVLHGDISKIVTERLKEKEEWWKKKYLTALVWVTKLDRSLVLRYRISWHAYHSRCISRIFLFHENFKVVQS